MRRQPKEIVEENIQPIRTYEEEEEEESDKEDTKWKIEIGRATGEGLLRTM